MLWLLLAALPAVVGAGGDARWETQEGVVGAPESYDPYAGILDRLAPFDFPTLGAEETRRLQRSFHEAASEALKQRAIGVRALLEYRVEILDKQRVGDRYATLLLQRYKQRRRLERALGIRDPYASLSPTVLCAGVWISPFRTREVAVRALVRDQAAYETEVRAVQRALWELCPRDGGNGISNGCNDVTKSDDVKESEDVRESEDVKESEDIRESDDVKDGSKTVNHCGNDESEDEEISVTDCIGDAHPPRQSPGSERSAEMETAFDAKKNESTSTATEGNRVIPSVAVTQPFPTRPRAKTFNENLEMFRQPSGFEMGALDAVLPVPIACAVGRSRAETVAHEGRLERLEFGPESRALPMEKAAGGECEAPGTFAQTAGGFINEPAVAGDSHTHATAGSGDTGRKSANAGNSEASSVAATVGWPGLASEFDENTPLYGIPIVDHNNDDIHHFDNENYAQHLYDHENYDQHFYEDEAYAQYLYSLEANSEPFGGNGHRPVHADGLHALAQADACRCGADKSGFWKRLGAAFSGEGKPKKLKKKQRQK